MPLILNHLNHISFLFLFVIQFKLQVINLLGESRIRCCFALQCILYNFFGLFRLNVKSKGLLFEVFNNFVIHMDHLDVVNNELQDLSCEGGKIPVRGHPVDVPKAANRQHSTFVFCSSIKRTAASIILTTHDVIQVATKELSRMLSISWTCTESIGIFHSRVHSDKLIGLFGLSISNLGLFDEILHRRNIITFFFFVS